MRTCILPALRRPVRFFEEGLATYLRPFGGRGFQRRPLPKRRTLANRYDGAKAITSWGWEPTTFRQRLVWRRAEGGPALVGELMP